MEKKQFLNPTQDEDTHFAVACDVLSYLIKRDISVDDMLVITSMLLTVQCRLKEGREDLADDMVIESIGRSFIDSADLLTKEDAEYFYSYSLEIINKHQ